MEGSGRMTTVVDSVPLVALDRQHDALADELRGAYERTVASSALILGAEVEAFEREFAAYCGSRACVGVASGTAAISLALQSLGIGAGDEVIVPAFTFIASALGVLHAGAKPVLCEVDPATGLMDPSAAAAAMTDRTAAIVAVHLYGQCVDVDELPQTVPIVEDAAQAHGATLRGRRAGSLGTVAAFSFYPSKNLGALGDGGAVVTSDADVDARARALRNLGQLVKGEHRVVGWNERLDGMQAAFLRAKLPHLDSWNAARRAHAAAYREHLDLPMLPQRPETEDVFHLFPVRFEDRQAAATSLGDRGVGTGVHYDRAVHGHEATAGLGRAGEFPAAEAWAAEELSLPMFAELRAGEIDRVVDACRLITR
jgi:dTDP-3-amino-3,4,6-trideoxy-alpha-D-glucose transaminase